MGDRHPVVLVHGINDTSKKFQRLSGYLQQQGWQPHGVDLSPNNGSARLEELATQVADFVARRFDMHQMIDLIGFSMGGMVSRYYIQRLGGIDRVHRFISISAPNQGTWLAHGSRLPGCQQMRPDSEFIKDLDTDVVLLLSKLKYTCIWTPFDLMIVPASSSCLGIGREVMVPVPIHAWMLDDKKTWAAVEKALVA
jgi:triacylglycerol lipase